MAVIIAVRRDDQDRGFPTLARPPSVPTTIASRVSRKSYGAVAAPTGMRLAKPKSTTFANPSSDTIAFSGFRSR